MSALVFLGCTTGQEIVHPQVSARDPYLAALTSGTVGCPPEKILISSYQSVIRRFEGRFEGETSTWTAKCRGKQFYCSGSSTTRCHEELPPAAPATTPGPGPAVEM